MCGIAGYFGSKLNSPKNKNLIDCKVSLSVRGPDYSNISQINFDNNNLTFIHSRLSIIDKRNVSHQPFEDEYGIITFNGMIYNYLELKKELRQKGINFKTKSDTEVLLKMLNMYSVKALKKLEGMWSFAYFNKKSKKLVISRDRLGEKPLYYYINKGNFYFSNSVLSLKKIVNAKFNFNFEKINNLLSFSDKTYGLDNSTVFSNVSQVTPGSYVILKANYKTIKEVKFWKIRVKQKKINYKTACANIKKIINDVIKKNVRSDVNNSVLISGGLDSNTIVSKANKISKIAGYSLISTNSKYDEKDKIEISKKFNNFKVKYISSKKNQSLKILKDIIFSSLNILFTPTSLGLALLCNQIKKDNRRVVLTGIGGDELFCGYYINYLAHINSFKKKSIQYKKKHEFWRENINQYIRNKNLKDFKNSLSKINKYKLHFFTEGTQVIKDYILKPKKIYVKNYSKDIFYNNMLQNIYHQSIPTQLAQTDLVTMHYNIESRSPFLSNQMFDYIYGLKKDFFMYNGRPKSLLRDSMKNIFPKKILNNYEKTGFYSPFKSFFKKKDFNKVKKYLKSSQLLKKFLKYKNFLSLLKKEETHITHEESKFLFMCLNLAILEKANK